MVQGSWDQQKILERSRYIYTLTIKREIDLELNTDLIINKRYTFLNALI